MLWKSLESLPGLIALPEVWRAKLGENFPPFHALCLRNSTLQPESILCARNPPCSHRIIRNQDGSILGACDHHRCPDRPLTLPEITPLELDWDKLLRAISKAFACAPKIAQLPFRHTYQACSWSADAVPIILTIQTERHKLRSAIAELGMRLHRPYILLTPTNNLVDTASQELIADAKAAIFPLDTTVHLEKDGTLRALPTAISAFQNFSVSAFPPASPLPAPAPGPRYAIRKGLGVWYLIFDGKKALLKHERGIFYVAYLLIYPPPQPIHALDLMAKIPEIYRKHLGITEIIDPATGRSSVLQSHARIQERNLGLDDAQAMRALLREERELQAILDDPDESEPVKAETLRQLEAIAEFQKQHGRRTQDSAQNAADTVRKAIRRLHDRLSKSLDLKGNPHPVLRQFALHLEKYILVPSARYSGPGPATARTNLAGCLTYEPPPGILWAD